MRVLESIRLKVKKPMILNVNNRGAKDLCGNWSVGGRTRHVEVKQLFLRELKESKIIDIIGFPEKKCEAISSRRIFQDRCSKSTDPNMWVMTNI
jgi:hypothetical protein